MVRLYSASQEDEATLVYIARVCTGREDIVENMNKTVTRLIKDKHWSVFDHVSMTFEIEAPIYVMRQWMRHQGAWMEKSRRYTKDHVKVEGHKDYEDYINMQYEEYLLEEPPEEARKILPVATYTKCIWTASLRTVFHFLRLRLDSHAQKEIRDEAIQVAKLVRQFFPVSFKAWVKYDFLAYSVPEGEDIKEVRRGQATVEDRRRIVAEIMEGTEDWTEDS